MKSISIAVFAILVVSTLGKAQKRVYCDSLGNETSFLTFCEINLTGKYELLVDSTNTEETKILWRPATEEEMHNKMMLVYENTNITSELGKTFPEITFTDLEGRVYDANSFSNKLIILDFWFVGCANCEYERSGLNELYNKYHSNPNILFLSFSKSSEAKTLRHLEKRPRNWPVVLFDDTLQEFFKIDGYPTHAVVNKNGKYQAWFQGIYNGFFLALENEIIENL